MTEDDIRDLFASFGPVTIRRMFGGKGIYADGRIFALDLYDEVMLKADAISAPDFAAAGCRQWVYEGKNKPVAMPYWSIPDAALDDPDEMAAWARKSFEAALRTETAATAKKAAKPRKRA